MSAAFRNSANNLLRLSVRGAALKSATTSVLPIVPVKAASTCVSVVSASSSAHGPNHENCVLCAQRRFASTAAARVTKSSSAEAVTEELDALNLNNSAANNVTSEASEAWNALQSLKSERQLSLTDYATCMRKLAEARDFTRAFELLQEMKSNANALPDAEIFSLVLSSVRRTLRPSEIRQLFGEVQTSPRFANNSNEDGETATASPFFSQVKEIVGEMQEKGFRPAMWFYEEFANQFAVTNQGGLLINLATAMEKRGEEPSTKFYNRMLHCLPRCGLIDRASMLFNRMVLRGTADYYSYLVRASSLIYTNQPEAARAIISDARARFQLDSVAYNILIKSHLAQRDSEEAIKVFHQMTKEASIAPTRVTCRTFLSYFYESGDLSMAEPVVAYFAKAGFPETVEDYGNLVKFFARFDPPRVLEVMRELKNKSADNMANNHILHAFLRILNDRRVMPDWKRSFAEFILEQTAEVKAPSESVDFFSKYCPELPYHYRMILQRITSPDATTLEIVMKKLLQLRRFDAVRSLYDAIFAADSQAPTSVSVASVHRNLYLTALLSANDLEASKTFVADMQQRRIPISGKNTSLMESLSIALPAGAMTAKKGQGVTVTPRANPAKLNII